MPHGGQTIPAGDVRAPAPPRSGHLPRLRVRPARPGRALRAALAAGAIVVAAAVAAWAVTPGVGDAEHRVEAILRAHGAVPLGRVLPSRVAASVVAIEDKRFWHHGAIDPVALGRVAWQLVTHPGHDPGGATIAQQLARNLYYGGHSGLINGVKAVVVAFKLEHRLGRAGVLRAYLESSYFGHGAWGVGRAAVVYFGRSPYALGWGPASMIAGLLQAPSALDPIEHWPEARSRQRAVLHQLVAVHVLTPAQAATAYAQTPRPGTTRSPRRRARPGAPHRSTARSPASRARGRAR